MKRKRAANEQDHIEEARKMHTHKEAEEDDEEE
jgi:hypothetical protein